MRHILSIFFLIFCLSTFGQTKFLYRSIDEFDYYTTNDTILYFEFKDTCQISEIGLFLDSLSNYGLKLDTLFGNLYRISYNRNQKNNVLTFFQNKKCFNFVTNEYHTRDSSIVWPSNSLLVKVKMNENIDSLLVSLNNHCTVLKIDTLFSGFYIVDIENQEDIFSISNQLFESGKYDFIRPSLFFTMQYCGYEDNPYFPEQYYLNPYSDSLARGIDALNAWEITTGDTNIKIAVLDGGVCKDHPDLVNNIWSGIDVASGVVNTHGGNAQGDSHGTMVAGIIVAENNDKGIVGVAHTSKVFPVKIGYDPPKDSEPSYDWTDEGAIIRGLLAAYDSNCVVVNGSFHFYPPTSQIYQSIDSTLKFLAEHGRGGKGIPLVFAAGNNVTGDIGYFEYDTCEFWGNYVKYPASSEYTIAVGGANIDGSPYINYNHGKGLDLIAPAISIQSTTLPGTNINSCYSKKSGTSYATPLVAGTIALMLSVNSELTYKQIKEILFTSTIIPSDTSIFLDFADDDGHTVNTNLPDSLYGTWNICYGYGALNAHAAVVEAALYGIPPYISGPDTINLCDEIVLSVPEFDIPHWVDSIYWELNDNLKFVEQIDSLTIRVKSVGIGEGEVFFKIRHKNYAKKIRKVITISSQVVNSFNSHEFNGNQSITSNALISGKNIVKENCTLTISAQVQCTPNASIVVEPKGKLIINNGSLINYCSNTPWHGIIVEGNSTQSQMGANANQGIVILNGVVIENAVCGIKVGDQLDLSKSGGIVYANNTEFKNCMNSVLFTRYQNMNNNIEFANQSEFINCNFVVDSNFIVDNNNFLTSVGMIFDAHVKLLGVNGIIFTGCTFTNTRTAVNPPTPSGIYPFNCGIRAFNSGFTVQPKCSSIPFLGEVCDSNKVEIASLFTGLDYGIIALNGDGFYEISILSTNFELNDYGIYLSGINNVRILKNRFIIGKDSNSIVSKPVGLYLQNGSGFRIEENLFRNNTVSNLSKIGLNIKNSGAENNQVYKNQFKNLTYGQIFDGNNCSQRSPATGLVSLCNKNLNNITYDFWVRPIVGCYNGINPYQDAIINTGSGLDTVSAGNQFSSVSSIDIQYNNEGNYLFYKYNPNNTNEILEIYTPTTITRESSSENPCRSKINALYPDIIDAELASITLDYTNLKYNYNQLIDAGNTPEMLQLIQGEWSDDIWNLRVELLGQSPYLSQDAILMVAMENLLPPALLLEVCIANPDATRSEEFLDQLRYKIPTPLPEYMINMIRASWENKTLRTEMEKQLSAFKTYRDEYHNYKTEILLSDTIYNYNNIIDHLESRGSYGDYLSMAEIAISQNNFTQADIYLDILENSTEQLDGEEVKEVASFREYISIRESIALNNKTIYNLDSSQIATLETYAYSNNYRGAILARNILCALYDICIDDIPAPPRSLRVGSNEGNNHNNIPFIASVKVMPNPASEYAAFIWDMKSFDKSSVLYIYDQNGKIIVTQPIHTQQGEWVWNVKNIPDGVYVYTFKSDQLVLFSGKLIISK